MILGQYCTILAGFVPTMSRQSTAVYSISISGSLSQVYILPLAGDMLVGVSDAYAEDAAQYLPDYLFEKTEIGQL